MQYVHHMFNVSALLLDDALMLLQKSCFQLLLFKTLTFHKVV